MSKLCRLRGMERPPHPNLVALVLYACLSVLCACHESDTATAISVIVDSDLQIGSELSSIRVGVLDKDGQAEQQQQSFALGKGAGQQTLPFHFRLARSSNEAGTYRIVVTGRGPLGANGEEIDVAEQQALVVFRPHVSSRLDMFLARICLGQLCRDQDTLQTCDTESGQCGALPIKGELEQDEAGVVDGLDGVRQAAMPCRQVMAKSKTGYQTSATALSVGHAPTRLHKTLRWMRPL
jgi:hypothetical protein